MVFFYYGTRNNEGKIILEFALAYDLVIANAYLKKGFSLNYL